MGTMNAHKHPAATITYIASLKGDPKANERILAVQIAAEDLYARHTSNGFHTLARYALKAAVIAEKARD